MGTSSAKMRGLRQRGGFGRGAELAGQAKALAMDAARAVGLAEHRIQGVDQIDRRRLSRAGCLYHADEKGEQAGNPGSGDGLAGHFW
jgi:hypothetical protein